MTDSNSSEAKATLPRIVRFMCVCIFVMAVLGFLGLMEDSPEASGLCLIAAAIVSGSLARAVMG